MEQISMTMNLPCRNLGQAGDVKSEKAIDNSFCCFGTTHAKFLTMYIVLMQFTVRFTTYSWTPMMLFFQNFPKCLLN